MSKQEFREFIEMIAAAKTTEERKKIHEMFPIEN